MLLAVDSGNTRIKWGLHDGADWLFSRASSRDELTGLESAIASHHPAAIVISNVAGPEQALKIERLLAATTAEILWVTAGLRECGVENHYRDPAQLGPDRWASLIAARPLLPDGGIVATLGTAITVDLLGGNGIYPGGLIAPGMRLMQQSIFDNTALQPPVGRFAPLPDNTQDAIASGIVCAAAGLIEHFARANLANSCVLAGGDAALVARHLDLSCTIVDNLVLDGLRLIFKERLP